MIIQVPESELSKYLSAGAKERRRRNFDSTIKAERPPMGVMYPINSRFVKGK